MINKLSAFNFYQYKEFSFSFFDYVVVFYSREKTTKSAILWLIYYSLTKRSNDLASPFSMIKKGETQCYGKLEFADFDLEFYLKKNLFKKHFLDKKVIHHQELKLYFTPIFLGRKDLEEFIKYKSRRQAFFDNLLSIDKKIYSFLINDFKKTKNILEFSEKIFSSHQAFKFRLFEKIEKLEIEIFFLRKNFFQKVDEFFRKNTKQYLKEEYSLQYQAKFKNSNDYKKGLTFKPFEGIQDDDFYFRFNQKNKEISFQSEDIYFLLIVFVISCLEMIKQEYNQDFFLLLDSILEIIGIKYSSLLFEILKDKGINSFLTTKVLEKKEILSFSEKIQIINL